MPEQITATQLAEILTSNGLIETKIVDQLVDQASRDSKLIEDLLLEHDLISDEQLGFLISDFYKLPFVRVSQKDIPAETLNLIPQEQAQRWNTVSYNETGDTVELATANPSQTQIFKNIAQKAGKKVKLTYATKRDIEQACTKYQRDLTQAITQLIDSQNQPDSAKIIDTIIYTAYMQKASDIHLEPTLHDSLVRFRIDGVLHDMTTVARPVHDMIVTRIKVLAQLRTDEHLSAQDGKMKLPKFEDELDIRISIVPIIEGEKVVMRLLAAKSRRYTLSDLGFDSTSIAKVKHASTKPYGMILATGPTGSGKTTTMYSIIKILNTRDKNIATIEDPVEYDIRGPNQIQVNVKTNLTFAQGLRSILRQDPDIIFVGEIRDQETAEIAVNAAMTGHLVLSTLHTNNAAGSIPRLISMGIEPFMVASTVNLIIGQRLVRQLCPACRYSYNRDQLAQHLPQEILQDDMSQQFNQFLTTKHTTNLYSAKGCDVCRHTGYTGRLGLYEVLEITPAIRSLIIQKANTDVLHQQAVKDGMQPMYLDGFEKVTQGMTSLEEVLRVARS